MKPRSRGVDALRTLDYETLLWMDRKIDEVAGDSSKLATEDVAVIEALIEAANCMYEHQKNLGIEPGR